VGDKRFWDEAYDTTHQGEFDISPMDAEAQVAFWKRYADLPHPFSQ
jgi:hypothetical protein